jgi:Flp pilus assembly protein TadG
VDRGQADKAMRSLNVQRRRAAQRTRGQRGQSIVIFALTLTVMLGLAGLAIDALRLYDLYARMERAAEAGALAGVSYMPCFYDAATSSPPCTSGTSADANSAVSRALEEVYKNGIGTLPSGAVVPTPCPSPVSLAEVAVCSVSGRTTDLSVTITETLDVFLLSGIGIGPSTISATAQAEYLPAIQLGSRLNYIGDQAECVFGSNTRACDPRDGSSRHLQNFFDSMNGPSELKEMGDPYVYCEEGNSLAYQTADSNWNTGPYYATYNDPTMKYFKSNQPQYADSPHCGVPSTTPLNLGNPDQQPPGYDGPMTHGTAHPGAHNYNVVIPPGEDGSSVWIYDPGFIPDNLHDSDPTQPLPVDNFFGPYARFGALTYNGYFDDPSLYFNATYTVYAVPLTYVRSADTIVGTPYTVQPYDMMHNDLLAHGCALQQTQVYDLKDPNTTYTNPGLIDKSGAHCIPIGSVQGCFKCWVNITPTGLAAGEYRLAVEATGLSNTLSGWGGKQYGVKVCAPGAGSAVNCAAGGDGISAWNTMNVLYETNSNQYFDLANIPVQYAGRKIIVSLFDPGDSLFNVYIRLVPPAGSGVTVTYPAGIRTGLDASNNTAIFASNNGDRLYNGLWISTEETLPSTYPGGWWQVYYSTSGGTPHDIVTFALALVGSPIHLVLPG